MKKKQIITGIVLILIVVGLCFGIFMLAKYMEKKEESPYFIELTGTELQKKVENKESFILVVTRSGCEYCEMYKPTFRETVEEYKLKTYYINFATFNKKETEFYRKNFNVPTTPQTLFINGGEETTVQNRIVGNVPKYKIVERLESLGYINSGETNE